MKLVILEMPEAPAELADWLERQLHGPDLRALVSELAAVHGTPAQPVSLDAALGVELDPAIDRGLQVLPVEKLRLLLRQPGLLLDLQERALLSDSARWQNIQASSEEKELIERGAAQLRRFVGGQPTQVLSPLKYEQKGSRTTVWLSLAGLAAIITILILRPWESSNPREQGWEKPGALAQSGTPGEYLNRLAGAAQEWLPEKPEDKLTLTTRLASIRKGCAALLAADHRPLSPADRIWLNERCKAWDAKFAQFQSELEGGKPSEQIGKEVDATLVQLLAKLREKAAAT